MKVTLKTMDRTGDSAQTFNLADEASKKAAQEAIDKARKGGAMVVTAPGEGKQGEVVQNVEQLAEENVVIPGIVAG